MWRLGFFVCLFLFCFLFGAGDGAQGRLLARQELSLTYIPSPEENFLNLIFKTEIFSKNLQETSF
jgi:hypothetical protein